MMENSARRPSSKRWIPTSSAPPTVVVVDARIFLHAVDVCAALAGLEASGTEGAPLVDVKAVGDRLYLQQLLPLRHNPAGPGDVPPGFFSLRWAVPCEESLPPDETGFSVQVQIESLRMALRLHPRDEDSPPLPRKVRVEFHPSSSSYRYGYVLVRRVGARGRNLDRLVAAMSNWNLFSPPVPYPAEWIPISRIQHQILPIGVRSFSEAGARLCVLGKGRRIRRYLVGLEAASLFAVRMEDRFLREGPRVASGRASARVARIEAPTDDFVLSGRMCAALRLVTPLLESLTTRRITAHAGSVDRALTKAAIEALLVAGGLSVRKQLRADGRHRNLIGAKIDRLISAVPEDRWEKFWEVFEHRLAKLDLPAAAVGGVLAHRSRSAPTRAGTFRVPPRMRESWAKKIREAESDALSVDLETGRVSWISQDEDAGELLISDIAFRPNPAEWPLNLGEIQELVHGRFAPVARVLVPTDALYQSALRSLKWNRTSWQHRKPTTLWICRIGAAGQSPPRMDDLFAQLPEMTCRYAPSFALSEWMEVRREDPWARGVDPEEWLDYLQWKEEDWIIMPNLLRRMKTPRYRRSGHPSRGRTAEMAVLQADIRGTSQLELLPLARVAVAPMRTLTFAVDATDLNYDLASLQDAESVKLSVGSGLLHLSNPAGTRAAVRPLLGPDDVHPRLGEILEHLGICPPTRTSHEEALVRACAQCRESHAMALRELRRARNSSAS